MAGGLLRYLANPAGRWVNEHLVDFGGGGCDRYALVLFDASDYHHFVGHARESVVAVFAVMANNFHAQRTFAAKLARAAQRQAEDDERRRRERDGAKTLKLPPAQPTKTLPGTIASESEAARPVNGPKGLEFVATPQGP